jgi:hypothetical protein
LGLFLRGQGQIAVINFERANIFDLVEQALGQPRRQAEKISRKESRSTTRKADRPRGAQAASGFGTSAAYQS